MSNTSKPAAKVSIFPVSAAIWRNERDGRSFYSVTFQRSYKDEKGKYRHTDSFGTGDLLLLAKVADQSHSEILRLRSAERQDQPAEEDAPASDE